MSQQANACGLLLCTCNRKLLWRKWVEGMYWEGGGQGEGGAEPNSRDSLSGMLA